MTMSVFRIVAAVVRSRLPHRPPTSEIPLAHRPPTSEIPFAICDRPQGSPFALPMTPMKDFCEDFDEPDYDDELDFSDAITLWCVECADYFLVAPGDSSCCVVCCTVGQPRP